MRRTLTETETNAEGRTLVLDMLRRHGEYELDELTAACPQLGWPQVLLEVDRLSREGRVRLKAKRAGIYVVALPSDLTTARA